MDSRKAKKISKDIISKINTLREAKKLLTISYEELNYGKRIIIKSNWKIQSL